MHVSIGLSSGECIGLGSGIKNRVRIRVSTFPVLLGLVCPAGLIRKIEKNQISKFVFFGLFGPLMAL